MDGLFQTFRPSVWLRGERGSLHGANQVEERRRRGDGGAWRQTPQKAGPQPSFASPTTSLHFGPFGWTSNHKAEAWVLGVSLVKNPNLPNLPNLPPIFLDIPTEGRNIGRGPANKPICQYGRDAQLCQSPSNPTNRFSSAKQIFAPLPPYLTLIHLSHTALLSPLFPCGGSRRRNVSLVRVWTGDEQKVPVVTPGWWMGDGTDGQMTGRPFTEWNIDSAPPFPPV